MQFQKTFKKGQDNTLEVTRKVFDPSGVSTDEIKLVSKQDLKRDKEILISQKQALSSAFTNTLQDLDERIADIDATLTQFKTLNIKDITP